MSKIIEQRLAKLELVHSHRGLSANELPADVIKAIFAARRAKDDGQDDAEELLAIAARKVEEAMK